MADEKERTPLVKDESAPELNSPSRRERIPLGIPRLKLAAEKASGMQRRWVNDAGGRLESAIQGGYNFVRDSRTKIGQGNDLSQSEELDTRISRVVDRTTGMRAFLMEIPEELYQADQELKVQELDMMEEDIRRGTDSHGAPGRDGRYVPKGGIKIERK